MMPASEPPMMQRCMGFSFEISGVDSDGSDEEVCGSWAVPMV
jgi:hypothetical protein